MQTPSIHKTSSQLSTFISTHKTVIAAVAACALSIIFGGLGLGKVGAFSRMGGMAEDILLSAGVVGILGIKLRNSSPKTIELINVQLRDCNLYVKDGKEYLVMHNDYRPAGFVLKKAGIKIEIGINPKGSLQDEGEFEYRHYTEDDGIPIFFSTNSFYVPKNYFPPVALDPRRDDEPLCPDLGPDIDVRTPIFPEDNTRNKLYDEMSRLDSL